MVYVLSLLFTRFAAACGTPHTFFLIPTWYEYLPTANDVYNNCTVQVNFINPTTHVLDLSILTLVILGVLDILLRIAALVAVGFIAYAGFLYVTAQGEPDKAKRALGTIIGALIGLGITIVAAAAVSFAGHRISS